FGHNRRDAAIDAGLPEITVEVRRNLSDRDALEAHLEENLVRSDLTFSDQVRAAVRWTSFYQGDRKSAAERLNWTVTRLAEKLELANCVDEVLDALDDGEIKAGHALILATMPEKTQRGSLQTIITESLSVKDLKQRAARIRLPLESAIFDKSDCADCPHSSARQCGLFDMGEADATCSNGPCYRDKTHAALGAKKQELEEQFGKVIFMSESVQSDRNT
ncbi:chromosome partitioning protein ParB, partial [Thalassospira xiamenensis]